VQEPVSSDSAMGMYHVIEISFSFTIFVNITDIKPTFLPEFVDVCIKYLPIKRHIPVASVLLHIAIKERWKDD
jgi:hypothetical protein